MLTFRPQDHVRLLQEEGTEWVTPDVAPEIIGDINESPQLSRYKHELVAGARAHYELGIFAQYRIKEANDRIERAHIDGVGRQVASFDAEIWNRLELTRGRGWWRDRAEFRKFLQENPMFSIRVNNGFTNGRSFAVRVDGFRDNAGRQDAKKTPKRGETQEKAPWEQVHASGLVTA